jgi:hypothetical protein
VSVGWLLLAPPLTGLVLWVDAAVRGWRAGTAERLASTDLVATKSGDTWSTPLSRPRDSQGRFVKAPADPPAKALIPWQDIPSS